MSEDIMASVYPEVLTQHNYVGIFPNGFPLLGTTAKVIQSKETRSSMPLFSIGLYIDIKVFGALLLQNNRSIITTYSEEDPSIFSTLLAGGYGCCFLLMFSRPLQKGVISNLFRRELTKLGAKTEDIDLFCAPLDNYFLPMNRVLISMDGMRVLKIESDIPALSKQQNDKDNDDDDDDDVDSSDNNNQSSNDDDGNDNREKRQLSSQIIRSSSFITILRSLLLDEKFFKSLFTSRVGLISRLEDCLTESVDTIEKYSQHLAEKRAKKEAKLHEKKIEDQSQTQTQTQPQNEQEQQIQQLNQDQDKKHQKQNDTIMKMPEESKTTITEKNQIHAISDEITTATVLTTSLSVSTTTTTSNLNNTHNSNPSTIPTTSISRSDSFSNADASTSSSILPSSNNYLGTPTRSEIHSHTQTQTQASYLATPGLIRNVSLSLDQSRTILGPGSPRPSMSNLLFRANKIVNTLDSSDGHTLRDSLSLSSNIISSPSSSLVSSASFASADSHESRKSSSSVFSPEFIQSTSTSNLPTSPSNLQASSSYNLQDSFDGNTVINSSSSLPSSPSSFLAPAGSGDPNVFFATTNPRGYLSQDNGGANLSIPYEFNNVSNSIIRLSGNNNNNNNTLSSSTPPPQESPPILTIKSGFLCKNIPSLFGATWPLRFIQLSGTILCYRLTPDTPIRGTMDLSRATLVVEKDRRKMRPSSQRVPNDGILPESQRCNEYVIFRVSDVQSGDFFRFSADVESAKRWIRTLYITISLARAESIAMNLVYRQAKQKAYQLHENDGDKSNNGNINQNSTETQSFSPSQDEESSRYSLYGKPSSQMSNVQAAGVEIDSLLDSLINGEDLSNKKNTILNTISQSRYNNDTNVNTNTNVDGLTATANGVNNTINTSICSPAGLALANTLLQPSVQQQIMKQKNDMKNKKSNNNINSYFNHFLSLFSFSNDDDDDSHDVVLFDGHTATTTSSSKKRNSSNGTYLGKKEIIFAFIIIFAQCLCLVLLLQRNGTESHVRYYPPEYQKFMSQQQLNQQFGNGIEVEIETGTGINNVDIMNVKTNFNTNEIASAIAHGKLQNMGNNVDNHSNTKSVYTDVLAVIDDVYNWL